MNDVTRFMYYMYNKWTESESIHLFGESLGKHIFSKWCQCTETLYWYASLSNEYKQRLVERAKEIYK